MSKEIFKVWLRNQVKTEAPLSTYPNALDRLIPEKLLELDEGLYTSLFDCIDLDYLRALYERFSRRGDLYEYNRETQNGLPSASIKKYIEFLSEQTKKESRAAGINIKNIILYGAPGVGKTHNYRNLISMIENGNNQNEIFSKISENRKIELDNETFEKIKEEQRVEFVTFHQSYSYEDFIEGFRPNEDGSIKLEDGIFKLLADKAGKNSKNSELSSTENGVNLDELVKKFTNHVQDSLDKDEDFYLDEKIIVESINENGSFLLGGSIKSNTQRLAINMIKRDYQEYKDNKIKSYEDIKPKYDSERAFHGNARYYFMLYKKISDFEQTLDSNSIAFKKIKKKNFYIVIDEINRGNISKIFGELITLIEDDKRDKYEVTLPYSKETFSVPSNLYIIATMNSTDKSIATIDIALRRRFTFLNMKPNVDLVENLDAKKLMSDLNKFIGETLGDDYKLGHSYFMTVSGQDDLDFVKEYKIKPLLEEYFYADEDNYKKAISYFSSVTIND